MNCLKLHPKCHAECCGVCPFPGDLWDRVCHRAVRPIKQIQRDEQNFVHAVSADDRCPFLGYDLKCAIYDDRPDICRRYGDESHILLTCRWQAADGRIRQRPERRQVWRRIKAAQDALLARVHRHLRKRKTR